MTTWRNRKWDFLEFRKFFSFIYFDARVLLTQFMNDFYKKYIFTKKIFLQKRYRYILPRYTTVLTLPSGITEYVIITPNYTRKIITSHNIRLRWWRRLSTTPKFSWKKMKKYFYGVILPVKMVNPNLVTFPGFVLPTFWAKKIFMPGRHPVMPAWHEKMNFRNFHQPLLYDTSLES